MAQKRINHSFRLSPRLHQFFIEVSLGSGVYGAIAVSIGHEDGHIFKGIKMGHGRFLFDFIIKGPVFFHVNAEAGLNEEMGQEPVAGGVKGNNAFHIFPISASYAKDRKAAHGVTQDEGLFAVSFFDVI